MDLDEIFSTERSIEQAEAAARLISKNPLLIHELLNYLASGNKEQNQKAAFSFHKITDLDKSLLIPYQKQILPLLKAPVHISVKRCILRLFSIIEINDEIAGQVINDCFDLLTSYDQPPAIKVFAMTTIAAIAQKHPDLMQELRTILEEQMPYASAGFRNRAGKILSGNYKFGHL